MKTPNREEPATAGFGRAASAGSVSCISAGCGQKKHAAQWLMDYPRVAWFPMCDRARHRLMHPPKLYKPGMSAEDFTPLPLNDQAHLSAPGGRVERNQKEQ
jgi:hypothetical protein